MAANESPTSAFNSSQSQQRKNWLRRASTSSDLLPPTSSRETEPSHNRRRPSLYEKIIEQRLLRGLPLQDARRGSVLSSAGTESSGVTLNSFINPFQSRPTHLNQADPLNEKRFRSASSDQVACSTNVPISQCRPIMPNCLPLLDHIQQQKQQQQQQEQQEERWMGRHQIDMNRRRCSLAEETRCVRFREGWISARGTGPVRSMSVEEEVHHELETKAGTDCLKVGVDHLNEIRDSTFTSVEGCDERPAAILNDKSGDGVERDALTMATEIVKNAVKTAVDIHCRSSSHTFVDEPGGYSDKEEQHDFSELPLETDQHEQNESEFLCSNENTVEEYFQNQYKKDDDETKFQCADTSELEETNDDSRTSHIRSIDKQNDTYIEKNSDSNSSVTEEKECTSNSVPDHKLVTNCSPCKDDGTSKSDTPGAPKPAESARKSKSEDLSVVMAGPIRWSKVDEDDGVDTARQRQHDTTSSGQVMSPHARMLICVRDQLLLRRWSLADTVEVTRQDRAQIKRNLVYLGTSVETAPDQCAQSQQGHCQAGNRLGSEIPGREEQHNQIKSDPTINTTSAVGAFRKESLGNNLKIFDKVSSTFFDSDKGIVVFDSESGTWRRANGPLLNQPRKNRRFSCDIASVLKLCRKRDDSVN